MTMNNDEKNIKMLNGLIDELISVLIFEDQPKDKDEGKPSDKNSYSYAVHLAKTIKEYLNDPIS
jgi:hypothetical protein